MYRPMNEYLSEIQILKALAHPVRIAILEILRNGEQCVCHFEAALGMRQAYISQQLMVLRRAGIVASRREGWNHYYRVRKPEIYAVLDAVYEITGTTAGKPVSAPAACTCPRCRKDAVHQRLVFTPLPNDP